MANNIDPDQSHSVASDLSQHCFLIPGCPNTLGKYGTMSYAMRKGDNSKDLGQSAKPQNLIT